MDAKDKVTNERRGRNPVIQLIADVWNSVNDLLAVGLVFVVIAVAIVAALRLINGKVCGDSLSRREYDGHTYILRDDWHRGGICHDPDCKCGRGDR